MTKIFVSSTFTDLENHRRAVREGIRRLDAQDISMENFGSRDEQPKDECLRLVKQSDLFVGIYAHKYGFIPEGDDVSLTEAEYNAATVAGVPRFIYILHPKHPWIPDLVDEGESKIKLSQFKSSLMTKHIYQTFGNEDNLTAKVLADLGRHLAMRNAPRVESSLDLPKIEVSSIAPEALHFHESGDTAEAWNARRNGIKANNREVFLAHVIEPTKEPNQLFDVYIYLIRHGSDSLSDVKLAEFFLGRYWANRVFPATAQNGFIGISTAAYGTFLCVCRVTFTDGHQIYLDRYIDFESQRHGK
jgi:uncharacterized protein DUF4062/pYEATS domain-containing protein involved in immunity